MVDFAPRSATARLIEVVRVLHGARDLEAIFDGADGGDE